LSFKILQRTHVTFVVKVYKSIEEIIMNKCHHCATSRNILGNRILLIYKFVVIVIRV